MSARTRFILAIVGTLLVLVAFFFFMIKPRQAELAKATEAAEEEEARTTALNAELNRLLELQERAPQLRAQIAELRQLVPHDDHEIPNFIFLVQAASNAAGVDFLTITPNLPETPPEGAAIAQIQVNLSAQGSYFSIQDLIRRLHGLDRAVRIDQFDLAVAGEAGGASPDLTLNGTLRIFFEPPAPPPAPPTDTTTTDEGGEA